MADFTKAYRKTSAFEGGYVHDPDDAGGETYAGIARRFNPDWDGWAMVDESKRTARSLRKLKLALNSNRLLQRQVRLFYKAHYWNKFWGDESPDQTVANELFDTSVNMGPERAVTFLQEGLNLLNRNQRDYEDIVQDGAFGRVTLKTLRNFLKSENNEPLYLVKLMNVLQGMHYVEYMRRRPSQEKYARGWLKRA